MYDATAEDLLRFAKTWSSLGSAITEQVEQVVENPDCGSCWKEGTENGVNPHAIRRAFDQLGGMNEQLDQLLTDFLKSAK